MTQLELYQLCEAAQHWLLEVVQFAIKTVPFPLLLVGICVQLMHILVEHKL